MAAPVAAKSAQAASSLVARMGASGIEYRMARERHGRRTARISVMGEQKMQERRFTLVARLSELSPGRLKRVEVAGRLIALALVAGEVFAVDDDCTHISGPLDQGELCAYTLTCPLHLARFDIRDGRVLRGPAREPLPTYAVRVEGDAVFVAAPDALGQ